MKPPLLIAAALPWFTACVAPAQPFDYTAFVAHEPRSILVLPPLDDSPEVGGTYGCLSTVTRPLAERGYYVFPVAVVDMMMRENGLSQPFDMHQVPLEKLDEIFAPDAVLYLTVKDWGTSYQILASSTTVTLEGVLVDVETGTEIWRGRKSAVKGSGGQGLAGMLANALVEQVASSISDPSFGVSRQAAWSLFSDQRNGLLLGYYHPDYEKRVVEAHSDENPAGGG